MDLAALQQILTALSGARIACVGDLMVDRFVYGDVTRVSPEAPIPVLARKREIVMLGAAGNVARNAAALGGQVCLVGMIGGDGEGREALRLIQAEPGVEGFMVTDAERPTTLKTRFVSGGQQLLRVDMETSGAASGDVEQRLVRTVRDVTRDVGVILVSDYGKGVVTGAVIEACRASGAVMIVDSKARSFARYGAVDVVKPNAAELAHATDMPTSTDTEIEAALTHALTLCEAKAILVTRAAKGISLAVRGEPVRHFPGVPREVFDASGAGDTTLAALGVALAAKVDVADAIAFAMLASGVAVGKAGTAVVTPEEMIEASLTAHMAPAEAKIVTPQRMADEIARWRARGLKVGFTNGCFDILHRGHVAYLTQARSWCDRLIVGVNSDRSVRALKGDGRPVNDLESRAMVLAGLGSVDLVAPFDEDTPTKLIEAARPDVLIKGADYAENEVVGGDFVKSYGGEVRLAQIVEGFSTTAAIARMQEGMTRRIIFVTGGAGFIGSNIVAKLAENPALDVVVCDWLHEAEQGKWRNIAKHPIGDFVAPEAMFEWLEKRWRDVELVVHMGAVSSTTEPDADKIIHANFTLSRDLFRWCADRQRRLVYASSAATYGDATTFEDRDDLEALAALRPLNTYGWSKALFDLFAARQAARDYAPPQWVGLKFFNVYGPNEEHKHSMKSVASQIWPKVREGHAVQLFKSYREGVPDGGQSRDFVYVRDVADVVAWLAQNEQVNGIYNLGSGVSRTFEDMAKAVFSAAGREANIEYTPMPPAIRDKYQYFTQARMERLAEAGYNQPMTGLEDGVGEYVKRYLSQPDPYR